MRLQPGGELLRADRKARRPLPNGQGQSNQDENSRQTKPDEQRYSFSTRHSLDLNVQRVCRTQKRLSDLDATADFL